MRISSGWSSVAKRRCVAVATLFTLLAVFHSGSRALAQGVPQYVRVLTTSDAYLSPSQVRAGYAQAGDLQRLTEAVRSEAARGVHVKLAIIDGVSTAPGRTEFLARKVRSFLNFSGVVVLVSNRGIGVASDKLSRSEEQHIESKARPVCQRPSKGAFTQCVILAAHEAVSQIKDDQASSARTTAIIWVVVLAILALIVGGVAWGVVRRRRAAAGRLDDLRRAASNTLSVADNAVTEIERASSTSTSPMSPDLRTEYDRALALRDTARLGLERGSTPQALTQANNDAAQAVLALQGVMRKLGITAPLSGLLETPGHRCFYCGRDDRPPYTKETIDDGKGNSMEVEVCSVDEEALQRGRRPEIATQVYQGSPVPWWAVPGNPYYYSYGGPTWQYWLPFLIGMDIGAWYGGGWEGYEYGDGGWGDAAPVDSGATADASAGDFGGWGGDAGGGDGGGDSGGDFGGGGDW